MSEIIGILASLLVGLVSALIPIINAEAYAAITATASPGAIAGSIALLAVGQTVGKLVIYEAARRGSTRFHGRGIKGRSTARTERKVSRTARWTAKTKEALSQPRTAIPLVVAAASIGLPPLAIVSAAAGVAGQSRTTFALACLAGRTARFSAIAISVAYTAHTLAR